MTILKKQILTFLASFAIIFSVFCCLSIKAYSSEEIAAAESLASRGVIVNHSDNPGEYNLGNNVLRQEIAAMAYEIAGLQKKSTCENKFSDVSATSPNSWVCGVVEALYDAGLIAKNDKFNPEAEITKSEALGMIVAAGYPDTYKYNPDAGYSWQEQLVAFAEQKNISDAFTDYNKLGKRGWIFVSTENVLKNKNQVLKSSTDFIDDTQILTSKKTNIVFASAMDRSSVEENIKIFPEIKTKLTWISDSELEVEVVEKPKDDIDIIVNVLDEALDSQGNKLKKAITKKFRTGGVARLDFISPEGKVKDLTKNITVRFSKPMVSLTSLDNQDYCPITISPALPGKCVWITTSTFQFRPDKGFPIGASYSVKVKSGLKTIVGDKTISGADIKITTPKFEVINNSNNGYTDKPLIVSFNSEVSLDNFKDNFSLSGFNNSLLDIDYLKIPSSIEGEFDVNKSRVSIFPKLGDWGYSKNYSYTLGAGLKSARGNISLGTSKKYSFRTEDLLTFYSPFVYKDLKKEEINNNSNFKQSKNKNIITKSNAKILLSFYEELDLNKSYFDLGGYNFTLKYSKKTDYIDGESVVKEDKKSIILEVNGNINSSLNVKILLSKINQNTKDKTLSFSTKSDNKVLDYKFVNYSKSCVDFKNDMGYNFDKSKFNFGDEKNRVSYISKIQSYSRDSDCKYIPGVNRYIVNTRLDPESNYTLNIEKDLLDSDNYPLTEIYNTSFVTGKALNQDKRVSLVDSRDLILVPTNISPLGVAIQSVNLDKVKVEVCQGDFDITNSDYTSSTSCKNREVFINDLKFKTNFSVLNLEEIFGEEFSKNVITLKVEKLDADKTESEKKSSSYSYYSYNKSHYLRTDKSLVLKANKSGLLWLSDFKTGENLTNSISKIDLYKKESKYDSYGKYITTNTYKSNIDFTVLKDGLYDLNSDLRGLILVTLNSGEQVLLNAQNNYYSNLGNKIYLTTDRPIYKPGDTVKIKGIGRDQTAVGYNIKSGTYDLNIRDSRYQNIDSNKLTFSANGTVNYEFKLAKDASLGNYSASIGAANILFTVEEYEKPDFKVESSPIKDSYLYSEIPKISVKSEYYIGSALSGAKGNYSVTASDYNFDGGKTTGYSWGENTYFWRYYNEFRKNNNNRVGSGEFSLDRLGKAVFDVDTNATIKDKIYNVSSTITDPNTKKTISGSTSFKLLNSDTFVGLKTNKYYYNYGDTAKFNFATVDQYGNKLANKAIKFSVYKINHNYNKTNYSYETEEKLLFSKSLTTGSSGISNIDYKISDYGEYRFEITTSDGKYKTTKTMYVSGSNLLRPVEQEHDVSIVSDKDIYNVGDNAEFVIQSPISGVKALVTVEKLDKVLYKKIIDIKSNSQKFSLNINKNYLPNFELKVFIIKDVDNTSGVLDELKDIRLEMIDLETQLKGEDTNIIIPLYISYDILYDKGFIPGYYDTQNYDKTLLDKLVKLRAKEQKLMQEILPNYYSGFAPVKISIDTVGLNSKVKTDKQNYLPGDGSTIDLTILDSNGKPVNGEAMMSVVDESLLALKSNSSDILDFFYSDNANNISTIFNMQNLIKRFEFKEDNIKESVGDDRALMGANVDYAESSMAMDKESGGANYGLAKSKVLSDGETSVNSTKLRTDFKDSAYYKAVVNVVNGKAIVKIPKLPDNLTTWVITGYTVTKDTKLGSFKSRFKVRKDLNILPSIPRFFVSGDEMEITATAINNTSSDLTIKSQLDIKNASIISSPGLLTVGANSQKLITWKVKVDPMKPDTDWDSFSSDITLKVSSGNLVDSLKLKRKIIPYSTPEYSFTNGSTYDLSYEEKINLPDYIDKSQGQIDITLGATILTNLMDSIDSLASMPFNNFYSTVSALKKGAVLKGLYSKAGRLDDFKQITVVDYNGDIHKLDDIIITRIKDIKSYQNSDGGMMSYPDCLPSGWMRSCSNFSLTGDFLATVRELKTAGYSVDISVVDKALAYYKSKLETIIRNYESNTNNGKYRNINPFYKILGYDKSFINKYLLSDRFSSSYSFDNISKLKIILLLQNTNPSSENISKYISELKNGTIIEARGSLFPSGNWRGDNIVSTALALRVFIQDLEGEKLIIENLARWLMAQKKEDGNFGNSYDSSEVIKTITDYIEYTKELEKVSFDVSGFLNSDEIIKASFNDSNKFELTQKSFSLKDYIKFGEDNSLGFEKSGDGKLYYDVGLKYFLPIDKIAPREEGIIVSRNYYNYSDYKNAYKQECYYWHCTKVQTKNLSSVDSGNKGDLLVGVIEIIVPSERNNVLVSNFIPAGAEIVNTNLDTTSDEVKELTSSERSYGGEVVEYDSVPVSSKISSNYVGVDTNRYYGGNAFNHIEVRDDKLELFADHLTKGTYKYTYVIKLNHSGVYHHRPATAYELKKPEIWGRTRGGYFNIK